MGRPKGSKNKPKDSNVVKATAPAAKAKKAAKADPERKEWKPGMRGRPPAWYTAQKAAEAAGEKPAGEKPAASTPLEGAEPPKPPSAPENTQPAKPAKEASADKKSGDTVIVEALKSGKLSEFTDRVEDLLVKHMSPARRQFFQEQGMPGFSTAQRVAKLVLQFFEISPDAVQNA